MATEIDGLHVYFWLVWYYLAIVVSVVMSVSKEHSNKTTCNWLREWHINFVFLLQINKSAQTEL